MLDLWYLCKVRYLKRLSDGCSRKVTERYIVKADGFHDAKDKLLKALSPFMVDLFLDTSLSSIYPKHIWCDEERGEGSRWYKARVRYIASNRDSGESNTIGNIYIRVNDILDAFRRINQNMSNSSLNYRIVSVSESPVKDVII